jgi:hypothetical protein
MEITTETSILLGNFQVESEKSSKFIVLFHSASFFITIDTFIHKHRLFLNQSKRYETNTALMGNYQALPPQLN